MEGDDPGNLCLTKDDRMLSIFSEGYRPEIWRSSRFPLTSLCAFEHTL